MIIQEVTRNSWDNIAAGYDEFVTSTHISLANEGLQHVNLHPGMLFLDIAAGSGALSIPAARLGAQVLSVDISAVMLARLEARARTERLNIETRKMDGHALELKDNTFDIVGSQFGVMLFPDMPRALREMVRVTKPGGRVLMNVFGNPQKVEFFAFFVGAIQAILPEFTGPSMDPPPLPFQLQDPETLQKEMTTAGLKEVRVETTTEKLEFTSGKQLWDWLVNSNPIVRQILDELNLTKQQLEVVQNALDEKVSARSAGRGTATLTSPINMGIGTK